MATILITNVLDPAVADGKDRFARQIREQILKATEDAGDRDAVVDIIQGSIFVASGVPKALDSAKALFTEVPDVVVKEIGDMTAMAMKSKLAGVAKRALGGKDPVKAQQ